MPVILPGMARFFSFLGRCGIALAVAAFALPCFAWGAQGHRLVARLGDAELTPEASCRIVLQPGVYPARPKLDEAYFISWTPVAEAQLRRAGTRLAQLLNAALAS